MTAALEPRMRAIEDELVAEWRELCRIPSVSGELTAIGAAAELIERRMGSLFDTTRRVDLPGHGPLLIGTLDGSGPQRLLLYTHYDVQPAGELGEWTTPPFSADLRDGCVWARGACDDKADVTARLQAIRLWREGREQPPPFSLVFLCDPAEEVGSPGLEAVLAAEAEALRADACLWESFLRYDDGRPGIGYGCRGVLEVRLQQRLLRSPQHTAFASALRSPALELMRAVASLTDGRGLLVPGLTVGVREPSVVQRAAADRIPLPVEAVAIPGERVQPFVSDDESEVRRRLSFEPSLSVAEIDFDGGGTGTVPARASVTIRFGLVPDQEPEAVLEALGEHLRRAGFSDVELVPLRSIRPAVASMATRFSDAAIAAAGEIFGEPIVYPVMIGAGPGRMFLELLGTPIVSVAGTLRPGGNMHGPNEHGSVSDYLDHVRFTVRLLERLEQTGL